MKRSGEVAERFTQLFARVRSGQRREAEAIVGRPIVTLVKVFRFSAWVLPAALALVATIAAYHMPLWTFVAVFLPLLTAFGALFRGVLVEADDGSLWLVRRWPYRRAAPARIRRPNRRWYFDTTVVINERQWCWYEPHDLERHLESDPQAHTTT